MNQQERKYVEKLHGSPRVPLVSFAKAWLYCWKVFANISNYFILENRSGVKFGNFCVISLSITHEIWAPKSLYNYCCKSVQLRCLQSSWVYLWLYVGFPLKWKRVWGFKWALFPSGRSSSRRSLRIVAWTTVACTIVLFI